MKNVFEDIYQMFIPENIPWNKAYPHFRLIDFLDEYQIEPCHVIDLGCGLGTDSIFLAKRGFSVTGVDISQTAVAKAHRRASEVGVPVDFWVSSALRLPFPDSSFELALDWRTSHCLTPQEWKQYALEISRILTKDGGLLLAAYYLSGFEEHDQKVKQRPLEKYPLNESLVHKLFDEHFTLDYFQVFELDEKTHCWAGLYFLNKKSGRRIRIDPQDHFKNEFGTR